jgi:hypothetical protein
MENVLFLHQKNIQKISLDSRPSEELGFDYDTHEDYTELGETLFSDAGLVNIENLINKLTEMRSHGATHVACDWHCDHQELDLYGVEYRLATQDDIDAYHNKNKKQVEDKKQREIQLLEDKLKRLKGE